jgi:2-polyprenyl-6-methoxyphenol hydroxylase-like FAD-dependent oxidoreductase
MTSGRVLVSGASIAGPALAYWLSRYGYEPTVVERAPSLRGGGQNIDVRGAGREVVRRMGIENAIRAATTGEQGVRFVDGRGETAAEFPARPSDTGGLTAELEILRSDLAGILDERVRGRVEQVFGDRVTGLHEADDHVSVSFERGADRDFDLVVAADGIRSSTRALVFGDEPEIRSLGLYMAYLTIPRTAADSSWARWYNAPGGRAITLRPDNVGTTRATLSFLSTPSFFARGRGGESEPDGDQKQLLRDRFADAGWEASRVLDGLDGSDDLYVELIGQVKAPHWSRGRVALVGDAAYCASPISGMGTSLALVGAYVLAGELAAHVDHRDAFRSYERILRPYVEQAQQLPPGAPRLAHPRTRAGIRMFNGGLRLASTPVFSRVGGRLFTPPADRIDLPDYAHLER